MLLQPVRVTSPFPTFSSIMITASLTFCNSVPVASIVRVFPPSLRFLIVIFLETTASSAIVAFSKSIVSVAAAIFSDKELSALSGCCPSCWSWFCCVVSVVLFVSFVPGISPASGVPGQPVKSKAKARTKADFVKMFFHNVPPYKVPSTNMYILFLILSVLHPSLIWI